MTDQITSLASARTATTNIRRIFIVAGFSIAMLVVHGLGAALPDAVFGLFALYIVVAAGDQVFLGRAPTTRAINRFQAFGYALDITFITVLYTALGGAWWMGSVLHTLISMAAFVSLPRPRARMVAEYAVFAFIAGMVAQAAGFGPQWSFLGAPSIRGNYMLAIGASLLGTVSLVAGIYIQITLLRIVGRSEKRHRFILKAAPEWIVTMNGAGKVTSANEATYLLTGLEHHQLLGLPFGELLDEEHRGDIDAELGATLADGISRTFEARYRSPEGELHWVSCSASRFSDESNAIELLVIARDTTEAWRAQEKLHMRETLLAETEELVHLGSWEWDVNTDQVEWSDEMYRIYGVERNGALTGVDFRSKVHPDDVERVQATIQRSVQTGETFNYDHRIIDSSGVTRVLHVVGRVMLDEAGVARRIVGSAQDVTERNVLTEQLRHAQKMEAVGRLAGGIAHDFNNILTVIKTYTGFLLERPEDDAVSADVQEIAKAADKAAVLTKQLLVFSRQHIAEPKVIDLNQNVTSLEAMLSRLVGADIEIQTELEPDLWCVRADRGQIEQVLMNLVVNARDAMPEGGLLRIETSNEIVEPDLSSSPVAEGGKFASVAVSDTGCGMSTETQVRIFEPFFTTKEAGKGTGLGLSIVYGIVQQTGGYVRVNSIPERGTTFRIYLPRVSADAMIEDVDASFAGVRGGSETILLVEDEEAVRTAVSRTLRGVGYNVLEAKNGREALMIFESPFRRVDLILSDMVMPEMGGRELATRIRRWNSKIPLVFMSGYTEDVVAKTDEEGLDLFVSKPFTVDALFSKVREALDASANATQREKAPIAPVRRERLAAIT